MIELKNIDLSADTSAALHVKAEVVVVVFARNDGELLSREGPNRYKTGDALITGSTGDRWSVSRSRFEMKYDAVPPTRASEDGHYMARPVPVLAKQMSEPFSISRCERGDTLHGNAGDWLLQYAPGDFGISENDRFAQVYRRFNDSKTNQDK